MGTADIPPIPSQWADGTLLTAHEAMATWELRRAGCRCEYPLIGWQPDSRPRCRSCDVYVCHPGDGDSDD